MPKKSTQHRTSNWDHWKLIPKVRLWQAVALSLGIEPNKVIRSERKGISGEHSYDEGPEFTHRLEIAKGNLTTVSGCSEREAQAAPEDIEVSLAVFGGFAQSLDWSIPPEMPAVNRAQWLAKDLWTVVEFIDLLNGGTKDMQFGKAVGMLRRAFAAGRLTPIANPHPFRGDPFFGQYLKPRQAVAWGLTKKAVFPRFPFEPDDLASLDRPVTKQAAPASKSVVSHVAAVDEKPLKGHERETLQRQIAVLALALCERSNKYKRGSKPNISQIAETAVELTEALPRAQAKGLSADYLRRAISTGLKLIEG